MELLEQNKVDMVKLRELCLTKHGLVNNQIRKKVWPLLLNVNEKIKQDGIKRIFPKSSLREET